MLPIRVALGIGFWWLKPLISMLWRLAMGSLLWFLRSLLLRRRIVHALELHAVGIEEIDGVVAAFVVLARRVDHLHLVRLQHLVQRVDVGTLRQLEGVVVEADVAEAELALLAARVGL